MHFLLAVGVLGLDDPMLIILVLQVGFEPTTPPPQTECANQTALLKDNILADVERRDPTFPALDTGVLTLRRYINKFWSEYSDSNRDFEVGNLPCLSVKHYTRILNLNIFEALILFLLHP